jgi:hypothetical protein
MSDPITKYLAAIGRRGGKAGTGKAKARTKAQARAAAKARWDKARALRQNEKGQR